MKDITFTSSLAAPMSHFIELKKLACTDYSSQARLLSYLDGYLFDIGYDRECLTGDACSAYLSTVGHLASRSYDNRYCVIRQFSIHLQQTHPHSYILPKRPYAGKEASRPAYIYTVDQVARLLAACEFTTRQEAVPGLYRTLFALLYATGIRIGEALALNRDDFTIQERLLHIRCGKFRKARYLILSLSMTERLEHYFNTTGAPSANGPLFYHTHHTRNARLTHSCAYGAFRRALTEAGIVKNTSTGPRIHDFRHTFAVHRLLQWYEQGIDVNAKLPYLSTYMGHVDILSTQVYLHPFKQLIDQGNKRFHHFFLKHIATPTPEITP